MTAKPWSCHCLLWSCYQQLPDSATSSKIGNFLRLLPLATFFCCSLLLNFATFWATFQNLAKIRVSPSGIRSPASRWHFLWSRRSSDQATTAGWIQCLLLTLYQHCIIMFIWLIKSFLFKHLQSLLLYSSVLVSHQILISTPLLHYFILTPWFLYYN